MSSPESDVIGVVVLRPIRSLRHPDYNPRIVRDAGFTALKASIKADPEFMTKRPVMVNTWEGREGIVIGGNARLEAVIDLGWEHTGPFGAGLVPCTEACVDPLQEVVWSLRDNTHAGNWDDDALAELIYTVTTAQIDVSTIGFDDTKILAALEASGAISGYSPPPPIPPLPPVTCGCCGQVIKQVKRGRR